MAGFNIVEIVDVGPGWNKVRLEDGNIYTIKGDYGWRSNNPGNIEYGPFAQSHGALGSGAIPNDRERGFAIFPTYEAGQKAREALLFDSPRYRDLTIQQAISRYAPAFENNVTAYVNTVANAAGVSGDTLMSALTPSQRQAFLEAQARHEGTRVGDIFNAEGIRLPPGEIPNVPPTVATRVNRMLDALPPVPKDRTQGTVARTKQALGLNTPKPANMPVGVRTQRMLNSLPALPPNPAPLTQRPRQDSIIERNRVSNKLPIIGPTGGPPLNGNAPFPATMSDTLAARRRNWNGDPGGQANGQVVTTIPTRRGLGSTGLAALGGAPQLTRRNVTGSLSGAQGLAALGGVPQLQQPRRGPGLTGVGLMAMGGLVPQLPRPQRAPAPLKVTVNGGTYQPPIPRQRPVGLGNTPVQTVQALTGLSSAQAYDLLNANARGSLGVGDRITGAGTLASSGSSSNSISSW